MRKMPSAASTALSPQRIADLALERALGGRRIELHLAAEKAIGAEPAEHQIGVGHRRLRAAEPVAGRPGRSARALRTEPQRAVVDPRDRAAAGADFENIHHRDLHRQRALVAADQRRAGRQGFAVINDAGFRGSAAHVEGDRVIDLQRPAQRLRTDDAGGGPGFQHAHALALRLAGVVKAAGRLHDQKRAGKAGSAHMSIDLADIAAHFRPDIGVGGHRRAALELAIFLRQFMRSGHEQRRMVLLEDRLGAPLVIGIGIAVEEEDGGGFDAAALKFVPERGDFGLVQRGVDLAVGQHALLDFESQRPLDQRNVFLKEQVVGVRPVDAADLVDVAKAFGDEQCGFGAGAFQHRIDRNSRAVQKQPRRAVITAGFGDACGNAFDQMRRRRQRLAESERAGFFVKHRDVGKSAADIRREPQLSPCHSFSFKRRAQKFANAR